MKTREAKKKKTIYEIVSELKEKDKNSELLYARIKNHYTWRKHRDKSLDQLNRMSISTVIKALQWTGENREEIEKFFIDEKATGANDRRFLFTKDNDLYIREFSSKKLMFVPVGFYVRITIPLKAYYKFITTIPPKDFANRYIKVDIVRDMIYVKHVEHMI